MNREEACRAVTVPGSMSSAVAGYAWARDRVGESGGAVYRLHGKPGAPDLYPKHGRHAVADAIGDEAARLRWLAGRLPAPAVVHFDRTADEAWLLMTAVPGRTAYQLLQADPAQHDIVVDALARFLQRLHAIPTSACPFNSDHDYRLGLARSRIEAGMVDEGDFDQERAGWTAQQVLDAMQVLLPLAPDPVVTHGDYSLDNFLIVDGEVAGCIDAGRVGIADRYQDLAIAWNCLGEFGGALQERFLQTYGITEPDWRKLEFYLMLDELF